MWIRVLEHAKSTRRPEFRGGVLEEMTDDEEFETQSEGGVIRDEPGYFQRVRLIAKEADTFRNSHFGIMSRQLVTTKIEWRQGGDKVYVTGSMFKWNRKARLLPA